jgi:solute carrier family 41
MVSAKEGSISEHKPLVVKKDSLPAYQNANARSIRPEGSGGGGGGGGGGKAGGSKAAHALLWADACELVPVMLVCLVGLGAAGDLLSEVQAWPAYHDMEELLVLVPVLLGMKDNVVMTLASRLTTLAEGGAFDTLEGASKVVRANMGVALTQSIVVACLSTVLVLLADAVPGGAPVPDAATTVALFATAMLALALVTFVVSAFAIAMILGARRLGANPDNIAMPLVSSLGDIIAIWILSSVGSSVNALRAAGRTRAMLGIIGLSLGLLVLCLRASIADKEAWRVLLGAWFPIIASMGISFGAGLFLDKAVWQYAELALLLPVLNGMGGGIACVYAARLSTAVQTQGGRLGSEHGFAQLCLALTVPISSVFLACVALFGLGEPAVEVSAQVVFNFMFAAILQRALLLAFVRWFVSLCYRRGVDADNYATPFTSCLADTIGSSLLWAVFAATDHRDVRPDVLLAQSDLPIVMASFPSRRRLLG